MFKISLIWCKLVFLSLQNEFRMISMMQILITTHVVDQFLDLTLVTLENTEFQL